MAEVALTSIAKSALQLFSSLAKDEFLLLWNSEKELKRLEDTIDTIGCLLQDADKLQSKGDAVQKCLSRLRNLMYDADDFFDALVAQVLRRKTMGRSAIFPKEVRLFFSKSNQLGFIFETAHKVKSLRESLDGLKADMDMCGFIRQHQQPVAHQFVRPKTHSFVDEESVIGRDKDRDRVIVMLLPPEDYKGKTSDDRSFSVVALIGFGGLGKTTLAQLVYNDERVKLGFDVCLWACINDLSSPEQVLIEIIASKEGRHRDLGLEKLQQKLREIIGGKKFLIVLDDIWDENYGNWVNLETILQCGKQGSKVLVTTRSIKVAECLDAPKACCVDLQVLSDESAWSLFVKKAFYKGEVSEYPELEPLGKKIVGRCGNVPLAIILVGSLLRHRKREVRIWSEFLGNELGRALSSSGSDNTRGSIKDVLMVSYNDLHPNLKLCFAYCSLFPKDYRFDKDEQIRLWISQGFIKPDDDNTQSLEKQGEAYFFHLVDRCLFQEVREHKHGRYFVGYANNRLYGHSAKMHDLLHDVAIDVAKTENIFLDKDLIIKGRRDRVRHISMDLEIDASFSCCNLVSDPSIVRTLLFHTKIPPNKISQGSLDIMLTSFRMLRTLNLSGLGVDSISDSIGELIHLRYLDLSGSINLKHLPNSICKLHHLMILLLRGCTLLEKLPPKIEKLVSLRQLCIYGCDTLESLPPGLKALTSLVSLDRLVVHPESGGLGYLNGLNNLCGVLRIELPYQRRPDAIEDARRSNMSNKHKLNGMVVSWNEKWLGANPAQKMAKDEAKAVLEALAPPENLEHLDIRQYGGEKLSSWFCMLKNVKELGLYRCHSVEYLEDEMKDNLCFPSLETLNLHALTNMKSWWRQETPEGSERTCLAKVSQVSIRGCLQFQGQMPLFEGIEYLHLDTVAGKLVEELLIGNPNCSSPSSLSPFGKLRELKLESIEGLICLPERLIRHLTALQILQIDSCTDLRWLSRRGLTNLSALRTFHLRYCECEIGDEDDDKREMEVGMPWKALQRLEHLSFPVWDSQFREGLGYLTSLKSLRFGMLDDGDVEFPSQTLQSLQNLCIGMAHYGKICESIDLRKIGIQNLASLKLLTIQRCKELCLDWETLLISMNLEMLSFGTVGSVVDVEDMVVEQPSQLRSLRICSTTGAKWVHDIPWKCLASLEELDLEDIGEMEYFPEGIRHLSSLRSLYILGGCEKVRSLPEWFPQLTSLITIQFWDCSEDLKRRCERDKGEDWPLIRHVTGFIDIKPSSLANELKAGLESELMNVGDEFLSFGGNKHLTNLVIMNKIVVLENHYNEGLQRKQSFFYMLCYLLKNINDE